MDEAVADVGASVRRVSFLSLALCLLGCAMFGCGTGEISNKDQDAKQKALDKVAAESPDADKVEH